MSQAQLTSTSQFADLTGLDMFVVEFADTGLKSMTLSLFDVVGLPMTGAMTTEPVGVRVLLDTTDPFGRR